MWSLFNLQMGLASLTFARKSYFLRLYHSHCHSIASGRIRFGFLKASRVFQRGFLLPARCAAQPAQLYGVRGVGKGRIGILPLPCQSPSLPPGTLHRSSRGHQSH